MLVSGPTGIRVTGSGAAASVARRNSRAPSGRGSETGSGRSAPSSPLAPWTSGAVSSGRMSGWGGPAATGTSGRSEQGEDTQRVARRVREGGVAADRGDAQHLELRPGEGERDRQGVVVAGVAVDDDGGSLPDVAHGSLAKASMQQALEPAAVDDDADVRVGRRVRPGAGGTGAHRRSCGRGQARSSCPRRRGSGATATRSGTMRCAIATASWIAVVVDPHHSRFRSSA